MHTLGSRSLLWIAMSVLASAAAAGRRRCGRRSRTHVPRRERANRQGPRGGRPHGRRGGRGRSRRAHRDRLELRRAPAAPPALPRPARLRAAPARPRHRSARPRRGLPERRRHLPQLRGAVGRHAGDRQRVPVDRAALQPRHELRGAPDLGAEGLRQRRHRRDDRARGPLHPQPARPRAPHRRDGAVPAQRADEQVRHRLADHQRGQHAGDLDRPEREPRRVGVRRRHRRLPVMAQEPPAQQRARRRSAPTSTATGPGSGAAAAARAARSPRRPTAGRRRSRRPRPSACATSSTRASSAACSRSRPRSTSTRTPSSSCGPTATRPPTRRRGWAPTRRRRSARWASTWPARTATRPSRPATSTSPTARSTTGCGASTRSGATRSRCTRRPPAPASIRPTRSSAAQTTRNREAVLRLLEISDCPQRAIGKETQYCGLPSSTLFTDDFEADRGWTQTGNTATAGRFERGDPAATNSGGAKQLGTTVSGVNDLVTGRLAGAAAGDHDVDGGVTAMLSPAITLTGGSNYTLSFAYYMAHGTNSSSADYLQGQRQRHDRVLRSSARRTTTTARGRRRR